MSTEEEQDPRQVALDAWCAAGLGELPLPESREQWMEMPLHVKMQLQARNVGLFEMFNGVQPLPADLERRMRLGQLTIEDGPIVEAAGHLQVAAELKDRAMAERWRVFEEGEAARAVAAAEQQEEWSRLQAEGKAHADAEARSRYVASLQSGQPQRVADLLPAQVLAS
jgi:hypothetical protein